MNALMDVAAEHILLESDTPLQDPAETARTVRLQMHLHDRIRRSKVNLILYEEGYLQVQEARGGKCRTQSLIDLRHLDARPALSRRVATAARRAAIACIAIGALAAALAYLSIHASIALSVALTSLVAAGVAVFLYLRRTNERVAFVTRHGRATAVRLLAGFGSLRRCRALVPELVRAIANVQRQRERQWLDGGVHSELRSEIREHYRLRESGAITTEECIAVVQRILGRFS